jgi:hypothetical protein
MSLSSVRLLVALTFLSPARDTLAAQDSILPAPVPMEPTPEQTRYIDGLRTVARGVAQLKDGIDRVTRTQAGRDTVSQRRAAQRLGGLCSTARSFISTGRPKMQATAYEDSMRVAARQLVVRVDSLSKGLPTCATSASKAPAPIAADLLKRLVAYEAALATFRAGLAPPKADSIKTPSQQ